MRIEIITNNKKQYLDLLLLADEQEDMIDRYLESGDMFALYNDDLKTINYDHPLFEDGIQLIDMIYLKKKI
jgi:hypothetical protein